MDDKVRTKVTKICIKRKWRLIESQIFELSQFQQTYFTFFLMIPPLRREIRVFASEIACLRATGSKCFKIVHFFIGRGISYKIYNVYNTYLPRVMVKCFDSQILQIWYQHKATKNIPNMVTSKHCNCQRSMLQGYRYVKFDQNNKS